MESERGRGSLCSLPWPDVWVHVMNIKVVPFTILDVSKVYWCPYNHFIHWSYMIASISIYIKSTFYVIRYKNEMKFHMLMFMNA